MPRPRESKNKAKVVEEKINEKITAKEIEIEDLEKQLKTKYPSQRMLLIKNAIIEETVMDKIKRTAITLALLSLFSLVVVFAAHSAHAEEQNNLLLGNACLSQTPPDYENAAVFFKRAGMNGTPEGYYRLAELYDDGMLAVGDPCTDDLEALGMAEAKKYYALAARGGFVPAQDKLADTWQSISQNDAKRLMDEACVVLDVRTREEYDEGHIPGAICVPVESITQPPELLPDYGKTILIYCRSGRRSKEAARKLASMGYSDLREFGGIKDWTGDIFTAAEDTDFLAVTGLSKIAAALKAGAVIEKVYYTEGYGFSTSEFTTTDPEEIRALWDSVRKIKLGVPSGTGITDWYPQVIFYLNNGLHFDARFEGRCLDIGRYYEIENAEEFWNLTKCLREKYESPGE